MKIRSFAMTLFSFTLFSCAHTEREPSAVKLFGLDKPEAQKDADAALNADGDVLRAIRNYDHSGVLKETKHEGSFIEWKDKELQRRLVSAKVMKPGSPDEVGLFVTLVSGSSEAKPDRSISQAHFNEDGELESVTRCNFGGDKLANPDCMRLSRESCWSLFSKKLAKVPLDLSEWKTLACGQVGKMADWTEATFTDAEEFGLSALKKGTIVGVGDSSNLFSDELKKIFSPKKDEKAPPDVAPSKKFDLKALECGVSNILPKEETVLTEFAKAAQPVAAECMRLKDKFPEIAKSAPVVSEKKAKKPHEKAKPKKKTHVKWIWN